MDFQVAGELFQAIDDALKGTLGSGMAKVMLGVSALFGTVWITHFVVKSIYWLFQGIDGIFQDIVISIGKMAFIAYFAFNVSWYIQTIVPFATGFPVWMGGILSGQEGNQTNQVDTLIISYIDSLDKLISLMKFGFTEDWSVMFYAVVVVLFYLIGGVPFLSVCVGTMITLKGASTIILIIGPLFIAFALFEQTRQWFWGWVSVVGGFMLTQILIAVIVGIEMGFINSFIVKDGGLEITLKTAFKILLVFGSFTMLITELPGYAASIMGGTPSGGVSGIGSLIGKTSGLSAARSMAGAAGKQLLRLRNRNQIK
ncbi:type IV secretion system protein [Pseudomonas sp. LW8]|uniref:type IV secretion system protein n=1 Tax=Pseudomonas sp. LW8 TaxID=3242677 RepID=UPI0035BEFE92